MRPLYWQLPAFVLACCLAVEFTFRLYALGSLALSPSAMNSLTTILESGLVEPAADLETYYQLKPNIDAMHGGARLTTNSEGLADREYSRVKPPGVYRVAVIGSSWTMPTGVEHQQAWHALLEDRLNALPDGPRYEFINFGVEYYGLEEIAGTLKNRVLAYQPDMVIAGLTTLTAYIVREPHPEPFVAPPKRYPFFESFALRALDGQLELGLFPNRRRPTLGIDSARHRQQTTEFIREIHAVTAERGIRLGIVWLGFQPLFRLYKAAVVDTTAELGIPLALGYEPITVVSKQPVWGEGFADDRYRAGRFGEHANAAGHALIAEQVAEVMFPAVAKSVAETASID
ncbi:MAG: hypothetical protein V2J12_06430 [Gammaproteobacteria bacterium]|jgi:hypothetical protein|nr:hypothetical protein [Gammaproteobacteria bacterium]